ncbi:MAG: hypothetical protein DJ555_00685 [Desulfurococcaceae archaeon]|nr:MAG: hypothetical protein DJ555_00685 [Desulfurococcaceae archaeon]
MSDLVVCLTSLLMCIFNGYIIVNETGSEGFDSIAMEPMVEIPIDDPECGSGGFMRIVRRMDPVTGPQISVIVICPGKGYKYFDEIPENIGGGRTLVIKVNGYEDLSRIIMKSRSATIMIPEIGLISTPRSAAVDEILTVDGILEKYVDHLEPLCENTENPVKCREVVEWMKRAMKGEESFTLIIDDPTGRSTEISI